MVPLYFDIISGSIWIYYQCIIPVVFFFNKGIHLSHGHGIYFLVHFNFLTLFSKFFPTIKAIHLDWGWGGGKITGSAKSFWPKDLLNMFKSLIWLRVETQFWKCINCVLFRSLRTEGRHRCGSCLWRSYDLLCLPTSREYWQERGGGWGQGHGPWRQLWRVIDVFQ